MRLTAFYQAKGINIVDLYSVLQFVINHWFSRLIRVFSIVHAPKAPSVIWYMIGGELEYHMCNVQLCSSAYYWPVNNPYRKYTVVQRVDSLKCISVGYVTLPHIHRAQQKSRWPDIVYDVWERANKDNECR